MSKSNENLNGSLPTGLNRCPGIGFPGENQGLREDEKSGDGAGKVAAATKNPNNFFNMEAASAANKMFSSYNNVKRMSLDEEVEDLEPVSPDNGDIIRGVLPKQKYLLGSLTIDYLQYKVRNEI